MRNLPPNGGHRTGHQLLVMYKFQVTGNECMKWIKSSVTELDMLFYIILLICNDNMMTFVINTLEHCLYKKRHF